MRFLIFILLLTSCVSMPPHFLWSAQTDTSENVYTQSGSIESTEVSISLVPYGDFGYAARVDDGNTIGKMPVIVDSTRGGTYLVFASFPNLKSYMELHGWHYVYSVTIIDYEILITYFVFERY